MKYNYFRGLAILLLSFFSFCLAAQDINDVGKQKVNDLKLDGKLSGKEQFTNRNSAPVNMRIGNPGTPTTAAQTSCNCWIPRDPSFQICQFDFQGGSGGPGLPPDYRNDDWSTALITLPFNICFYGTSVNQVFINNNGNISIGAPYSTFTANSFPDPTYVMIAPFWADVDTRDLASGLVYYSVTPTHLIVQWENVGYFSMMSDKVNTFQLIVTDGNDPILPTGQNISFCYKDMQWTTGSASQGVNGFGGVPATVGVNQGNGIDYIQFGLFDQAGAAYDGAYGANDGIDWLDNRSFNLNACVSNANIPPVLNSLDVCDTIKLCENTTYTLTADYASPESGQITNITFNDNGMSGVSVVSNTPGNTASLVLQITGQASNIGFHTISITATDDGVPVGISNNDIVVEIMPAPLPSFTYAPNDTVFVNTPMTFTNTSPPGVLLTWDFGDASPTTTAPNPSHTYTTGGDFIVSLSARFPNGCTTVITQLIHVTVCPNAVFTINNACENAPTTVTFTGGPTSSTATFTWDFNGASVLSGSGAGPYDVSWGTDGAYNVLLTITDTGCVSTSSMPVTVYPIPVSSISSVPAMCAGDIQQVDFTGTAGAAATFTWNFGGATVLSGTGAGPYSIQWTNSGNDVIDLTVDENGCTNNSQIPIVVNPIPTADFTVPPASCAGDNLNVNYIGTGTAGANYTWDFSGGNVVSGVGQGPYIVSWGSGGGYVVSLTVTENGCTSTPVVNPVNVTAIPVAAISNVTSLCAGQSQSVSYIGSAGAAANYTWNFGGAIVQSGSGVGPYNLQWNNPGADQISVIVNENGCADTTDSPVQIFAIPTADFTVQPTACAGDQIQTNYTGTASSAGNYSWDFTGANILSGSGQGPYSLNYSNGGQYSVSLTVTENGCVSPIINMPVAITPIPQVSVAGTPSLCTGAVNNISFTGMAGGTAVYTWTFGSANVISGSGAGPYSLSWNNAGSEVIHLDVNENGCSAQTDFNVTIYPIPTSDFAINNSACINDQLTLNYTGTATPSANYNWMLGGGNVISGSGAGPYTLVWSTPGQNMLSLTVDENGCVSTPTNIMTTINPLPLPFAGTDALVCSGIPVALGQAPVGGENYSWSPDFNLSDATVSNPVATPFNHTITNQHNDYILSVIDANGCRNTDTVSVESYPEPVVSFAPRQAQCIDGNSFDFTGIANIPSGVEYAWVFSSEASQSTSSQSSLSVTYSTVGTFPVKLEGAYNGCPSLPYIDNVTVYEMPTSDFVPLVTKGCEPLTVPFTNLSTGNTNTYSWSYGDGVNDHPVDAVHVFEHAGIYSVSLAAMNIHGCVTDTTYKDLITVYAGPDGQFVSNPQVANILAPVVQFQNYSANVISYMWSFGDSDTSTTWSPSHTYADTGTYEITLFVIAPHGCRDTVRGVIRVEDNFSFYIPNAFTPNGDGVNDYFRGYGIALKNYSMNIYNRWGEIIFKTTDYDKAWDGKVKSDIVQNDVYVYRIVVTDQHNEVHTYIGNVSVVR